MKDKDNYLKNAELATEQGYGMIDGIINNLPPAQQAQEEKPLDKVKEPPKKKRCLERER